MKNLEALVVHVLVSESLDVLLDECEISLIGLDGVAQVIFVNGLPVVSKEGSNGLDAGGTLKILGSQ